MPHQTLTGWMAAGTASFSAFALSIISWFTSIVAWVEADTTDTATHALALSGSSLGLALLALIKGYWDDRKDRRAKEFERFKAELEAKDKAETERRRVQRQLDINQAITNRNKLDAANGEIKSLKAYIRKNGLAIQEIGSAVDVVVDIKLPPEGSGEHPVLP